MLELDQLQGIQGCDSISIYQMFINRDMAWNPFVQIS